MDKPKISVICAIYNAVGGLRTTIEEMRKLKYPNLEFIVVDGGSKDGTKELLEKSSDIVSQWVSEPDKGIYDAWNKGIRLATGEWISFLGAGDYYLPEALNQYAKHLEDKNDVEFCSAKIQRIDENKNVINIVGARWHWNTLVKYMNCAHVGALNRRTLLDRLQLFDSHYRIVGDYDLMLRAGPSLKAEFLDQITANMVVGGVGGSIKAQKEALQIKIKSGYRSRVQCEMDYWKVITKEKIKSLLMRR